MNGHESGPRGAMTVRKPRADRRRRRMLVTYSLVGSLLACTAIIGTLVALFGGIPRWYLLASIPAVVLGIGMAQRNDEAARAFAIDRSDLESVPMPTSVPPQLSYFYEIDAHVAALGSADRKVTVVRGIAWRAEVDSEGESFRPTHHLAFASGFPKDWNADVELRHPFLPRWLVEPKTSGGPIADLIEDALRQTRTPAKVELHRGWLFVVDHAFETGASTVRLAKTTELIASRLASTSAL